MIKVFNLEKHFGSVTAVNKISFSIKKGEIFGLLGPNGAGKSTIIKILSTLLKSDSGSVFINGKEINTNSDECKKIIGVVPQEIALYEDFSAYDNLMFWGELNGVSKADLKQKIPEILGLIDLEDRKSDLLKTYSGGMKRRINIAAALLHNPKILFMDEPTTGVDPQSRNKIFDIIETLNAKGMTVVYTTHYMEEVERLCNNIAIIDKGKIIAQGTINELQTQCDLNEYILLKTPNATDLAITMLQKTMQLPIIYEKSIISVQCKPHKHLQILLDNCNRLKIDITDIQIQKTNLETIFLHLTGKQLRDY